MHAINIQVKVKIRKHSRILRNCDQFEYCILNTEPQYTDNVTTQINVTGTNVIDVGLDVQAGANFGAMASLVSCVWDCDAFHWVFRRMRLPRPQRTSDNLVTESKLCSTLKRVYAHLGRWGHLHLLARLTCAADYSICAVGS